MVTVHAGKRGGSSRAMLATARPSCINYCTYRNYVLLQIFSQLLFRCFTQKSKTFSCAALARHVVNFAGVMVRESGKS